MNIIDISKSIKNEHVAKGSILILQGQKEKSINIIHSGMAELLFNGKIQNSASAEEIIAGSRRVGFVKGESIYGNLDLQSNEPFSRSVRTITDCIISVMPISDNDTFQKLKGNIRLNLKILRALVQRIESCDFLLSSYKSLWNNLNNIAIGIALAAQIPRNETAKKNKGTQSSLADYSSVLKSKLASRKIPVPEIWDQNIFLGKTIEKIENPDLPGKIEKINIEELIDYKQFLFFKRLFRLKDEVLINVVQKDEPMTFYMYQFLSETLEPLIKKNEELANAIYDLLETLFSNDGWISQVATEQAQKNNKAVVFFHYMSKFCWQFRREINQLMGMDLKEKYQIYSSLQYFDELGPEALGMDNHETAEKEPALEIKDGALTRYNNLMNRILEFSYMGEEFGKEFVANMKKFKATQNKFENNQPLNKLKRRISQQYWQLYEKCFLSVIDSGLKNFIPGIMLHFGVLDETLLTKEQLVFIDHAFSKNLYVDSTIPVMTLPYYLEKIFKDEVKPSINELGQTFQEILRKQDSERSKGEGVRYSDAVESRIKYEIQQVCASSYKMVFGSIATAFPILCSEAITGQLNHIFLEPDELSRLINGFRQRDFSMFYRDIVLHSKFGSDIVQKEVIPDFVLYPLYGTKMLMWQELDGVRRDTKGRAFLPLFFYGDKQKFILSIIGNFRWELQRIMAGANWMDPVEGGLAGAYYDYINFYKKNPNLTPDNKERLKEFIKKTRSDKDRFTNDYMMWLMYEFEGIPKLTNVAREIFYRYCPFRKKERERLSQRPAFSNLEMKYQNIVRKALLKTESRIKKFEKSGEKVPVEITDFNKFLQL